MFGMTAASWSGGSFGSGNLSLGDMEISDLIPYLVHGYISQATDLTMLKTIQLWNWENPPSSVPLPACAVLLSSAEEIEGVGRITLSDIRVAVLVVYDPPVNRAITPGEITAGSIMDRINTNIKNNDTLLVTVGGTELTVADRATPVFINRVDPIEINGRIAQYIRTDWQFRVTSNYLSGIVQNIAAAS